MKPEDRELLREAEERLRQKREEVEQSGVLTEILRKSSPGSLDPADWPVVRCPSCGNERKVPPAVARHFPDESGRECADCSAERREAKDAKVKALELARRRANPEPLLRQAGVPAEYARFTRPSWEREYGRWDNHEKARRLIGWPASRTLVGGEQFVVLYGPYGVRKTSFAASMLGEALARELTGRWEDAFDWLCDLKGDGFKHYDEIWNRIKSPDVVVFDDFASVVGGRAVSHRMDETWAFEQLTAAARWRHMHGRPTLFTINVESISDLEVIDPCLPSRFDVRLKFKMTGPDYRSMHS